MSLNDIITTIAHLIVGILTIVVVKTIAIHLI